jgi:hypothetical protein
MLVNEPMFSLLSHHKHKRTASLCEPDIGMLLKRHHTLADQFFFVLLGSFYIVVLFTNKNGL